MRLVEASGQIASGNLDLPLTHLPAPHEIELLSDAYTVMQGAIRDRENLLRTQNQELEQANRDYQELLSFVTHELNNSVGSLLLNVSLLEEEASGKIPRELDELVDQVLRDVERFRDMVKNYLNLSRLEKGTLRFNPDRFDDINAEGGAARGAAAAPHRPAPPRIVGNSGHLNHIIDRQEFKAARLAAAGTAACGKTRADVPKGR